MKPLYIILILLGLLIVGLVVFFVTRKPEQDAAASTVQLEQLRLQQMQLQSQMLNQSKSSPSLGASIGGIVDAII